MFDVNVEYVGFPESQYGGMKPWNDACGVLIGAAKTDVKNKVKTIFGLGWDAPPPFFEPSSDPVSKKWFTS